MVLLPLNRAFPALSHSPNGFRSESLGCRGVVHDSLRSASWREWVRFLTGFHQRGGSGAGSRMKPDCTMEDVVFMVSLRL